MPSPRQIVKTLVHGQPPPQPLFIPLIFTLAAKLEGIPLPVFLANPTKLANALTAIHHHLRTDGVVCYFDLTLGAEALGCQLDWRTAPPTIVSRPLEGVQALSHLSLHNLEGRGRISVALEVVRRLRITLRDEPALLVGLAGPLRLGQQLFGDDPSAGSGDAPSRAFRGSSLTCEGPAREGASGQAPSAGPSTSSEHRFVDRLAAGQGVAEAVLDDLTGFTLHLAQAFCQAGADILVIDEVDIPPAVLDRWQQALASVWNVIRFHEGMPVVQCAGGMALPGALDGAPLVCLAPGAWPDSSTSPRAEAPFDPSTGLGTGAAQDRPQAEGSSRRLAEGLPGATVPPGDRFALALPLHKATPANIGRWTTSGRCVLIMTEGEIPYETDIQHLQHVVNEMRSITSAAPSTWRH